jgi:hypothetical protein
VLNKRIEVLLKMLKHDSSEETKTYMIHTKRSLQNAQRTRIKERILSISRRKLFTNHTKTSLYTPTFLKTFKKIFIR